MTNVSDCYNIADIRRAAQKRLPKSLFEFIDRATEDEIAVRNNRAAIERWRIMPRAPLDVSNRSLETEVFGRKVSMPMAIAPLCSRARSEPPCPSGFVAGSSFSASRMRPVAMSRLGSTPC